LADPLTVADCPIRFSLWSTAGTWKVIAGRLGAVMAEPAQNEAPKARLVGAGYDAETKTLDQSMAFLHEDGRINAELIKSANIKPE
jgi:hypothetical protein